MVHFELTKRRMNPWLVDPGNRREADEYTGIYQNGQVYCEIRAVIAVDTGERVSFKLDSHGAYIDPAAVERDFIAYLNPAYSNTVRSLHLPDAGTSRRPLEIIAGEARVLPARQRLLTGITSRIRGLLGPKK